jgi:signal transduction histidine kinase
MPDKLPVEWLAARGVLASGVARELAGPLDAVYQKLEKTVEKLDRHVASARGPEPLAWQAVGELRERVADVFLEVGRARQLAENLAALAAPSARRAVDVSELVERALILARHRFPAGSDVLLDLATLPPAECDPAPLVQACALLLVHVAKAVRPAGIVTVRTEARGAEVAVRIEAPSVVEPLAFADVIRSAVESQGGRLVLGGGPEALVIDVVLPAGAAPR